MKESAEHMVGGIEPSISKIMTSRRQIAEVKMLARSMFQNPQRNASFLWKQGTWIGLNPTRLLPPSMGRISRDSGAASSMPPVAVHRQNDDFPGDLRFEQRDNKDMDTVWIQWIAWILVLQYGTICYNEMMKCKLQHIGRWGPVAKPSFIPEMIWDAGSAALTNLVSAALVSPRLPVW